MFIKGSQASVAYGISLSNAAQTETTVQAESMLAWLAACWWAWPVFLRLSQGA